MANVLLLISLFVLSITSSWAFIFSPNVTIVSCTSRRFTVDIENAAEGGMVYIQGQSQDCSRSISSENSQHQFDFETCSIDYDNKFRLVIQRNSNYQTGSDKVIPIMCLVDTSDILVSSVIFPEEIIDADGSLNKTTKPIISMNMLGENETSQIKEVTLNEKVKLNLQLDPQYMGVFDIKATDCTASMIPILENECSNDEELFPNFVRTKQGQIISTFNAFQPTNLPGDVDIEVGFTCTVSVCKGACEQTICGEIVGWGRRRRNAKDKIIEDIRVETRLKIKTMRKEEHIIESQTAKYCAEKMVVTSVTGSVIVTVLFSWLICGCAICKLRSNGKENSNGPKKSNTMRRLSEINVNFAKSVGRRLSTMLNIPTGYKMNDDRNGDSSLGFETPPSKRRESVTVRNDNMFNLRHRFVTAGTQTGEYLNDNQGNSSTNYKHNYSKPFADAAMHRSSNSITSISISSAATKIDRSSIRTNSSISRQNSTSVLIDRNDCKSSQKICRSATIGCTLDNSKDAITYDCNEPIIYYDVDEVRRPYVGFVQVRTTSDSGRKSRSDSTISHAKFDGAIPRSEILCDGISISDSNNDDDVFEASSKPKPTRQGMATSKEDIDATHKSAKETNHLDNPGYDTLSDDYSKVIESKTGNRLRQVTGTNTDIEVSDRLDFIDDVYEVIEMGAQVKRERKHSTHV